jgi:hypothetical protein
MVYYYALDNNFTSKSTSFNNYIIDNITKSNVKGGNAVQSAKSLLTKTDEDEGSYGMLFKDYVFFKTDKVPTVQSRDFFLPVKSFTNNI